MLVKGVKTIIIFTIFVAFTTSVVSAQDMVTINHSGEVVDVKIYFPYDEAYIDPTYMGNDRTLHVVDSLLSDTIYIATLSRIEITAQSSPEGSVEYNEQLSERRRLSIKEYFTTNYPDIDPSLWLFNAVAENWELFHLHLVEDPNIPYKKELLYIVESDREPDEKEEILREMRGGKSWRYIKEHILPTQRFGASILFIPIDYTPDVSSIMAELPPVTIAPLDITLPIQEP